MEVIQAEKVSYVKLVDIVHQEPSILMTIRVQRENTIQTQAQEICLNAWIVQKAFTANS